MMRKVDRKTTKSDGYKKTKLGLIPMNWEIQELGYFINHLEAGVSVNSEDNSASINQGHAILKTSALSGGNFLPHENKVIKDSELIRARVNPKKGAILISRMNTPNLVGEVAFVERDYANLFLPDRIWQTVYNKDIEVCSEWLCYVLSSKPLRSTLKLIASGTSGSMKNISKDDFLKVKILVPTIQEREKIARILSTWDKAIEKTEQLITQKQLLKKGLMQQLLTGKVRFKEFVKSKKMKKTKLGLIPEDWDVKKGIDISDKITKGSSPNWQGFQYQESGVLFVTSENVRDGFLDIRHPKYLPFEFDTKLKNSSLINGDILINIVGASIGRSCIFDNDAKANINQAVCLFRSKKDHSKEFLAYFLQLPMSIDKLLDTQSDSARPNLTLEDIRNFYFPIPFTLEQRRIAQVLKLYDQEINALRHSLDGIKNQKKGLMQQLLTGKVRVKPN